MISLRHKLWFGFGGLLLILLVVSALAVVVLTRYSKALETIFRENYDSYVYCDGMKNALNDLNLRDQLLIWHEESASQIDASAEEQRFMRELKLQLRNCTLPGELEHTQHLAEKWKQYDAEARRFESTPAGDRRQLYQSSLLPLFQDMIQTAQWIADANMNNMISVDGQVKGMLLDVRGWLLVLVIAGVAAAGFVGATAITSILRQLQALTRSAQQIEAGNLDLDLEVISRDEIGQLAAAFNSMTAKLREFRRLDHDRLVRTQHTTQLAIDSLPDAVFIIGPEGAIEVSNRAASKHFGIDPGLTIEELSQKLKWLGPLYESAKDGRARESSPGYRSAIQLFDAGHERFLLPRAVPMIGLEGKPIGECVILVDVTPLRSADEAKSNVVSTVSHELRTPLTSIRMALKMLTGDQFGPLTAKQAKLLEAARQDSDRLYRIIENLMNISRIESGRVEFHFRPMPPRDIVSMAADPMRSAFNEKHIELEIDLPAQLPLVRADPGVITSALSNLLSNALKFTRAGGRVRIVAAADEGRVCFSVTDTGPGIPDEFAGRIFDKFFRVPTKEGPGGAGLGLAIAKDVVEAHGGRIDLLPCNGSGSTFRFFLPICDEEANQPSALPGNVA